MQSCAVERDEAKYTLQPVGTLVLPFSQSFDAKTRTLWDERMVLDVWYGLVGHRPPRKRLYQESQRFRTKLNAEQELLDVSSIDQIP